MFAKIEDSEFMEAGDMPVEESSSDAELKRLGGRSNGGGARKKKCGNRG